MQVKPIKRSKEFHCDSSTESSNNLWDIDRDIQYKTIRREQTAAPFFQFSIPQEKKSFDRKESKRNISRTYQEEHFSEEQSYKREQFREQLEEHICSRISQRIGFREIFMKSSQWSFYISVRNFLKVEMVLKCTLAGYSWSGWSRFRRPNDQRASTVKFTITIMQQWYLWKMWKNIKWCKLQVTV